jgi:hypothetical protein
MHITNLWKDWTNKPKKQQKWTIQRADQLAADLRDRMGYKRGDVLHVIADTPLDVTFVGNKISNIKVRKWVTNC